MRWLGWFRRKTKQDCINELLCEFPNSRVHDFTKCSWGHALTKAGDGYFSFSTPRVERGDRVRIGEELFVVFKSEPCFDPPDMAFIKFWRVESCVSQKN